jgi:hypothetical protein
MGDPSATDGRRVTAGIRLGIAFVSVGAMSSSCTKSVEVIGFGPLQTETQAPAPSAPPGVDLDIPTTSGDASAATPARDASTPLDASAPPDASTTLDAFAPAAQEASVQNQDAAPTAVLGPFSAPSPLEDFPGSDDASFTADSLEAYLDANDRSRIHVATRASPDDPWGEPIPLDAVGDDANGRTPWITPDGLQLYFAADRMGGAGASDIWWIERADRESPWGEAQPVSNVNSPLEEFAPSVSSDGLQLVLTRANIGLGGQELWLAHRDSVGSAWNAPTLMPISDPTLKDSDAVFAPDALEIWWVRAVTNDDEDLYFARRAATDEPFGTPTPATELNSNFLEGDPWLSVDGREIVFFSTRTGERLLYRATR